MGKHSNDKPAEPEKKVEPEIELPAPVERKPMTPYVERPSFDAPLTKLEPTVNASFKKQMDGLDVTKKSIVADDGSVPVGTSCKRGGCTHQYESKACDDAVCVHHPGFPIFHEGYKFWSCCQKKTSDFSAFLAQTGCESGKHKWVQDADAAVACRWDWHQTPSTVTVAIYAKQYDYRRSFVKVNPVRLAVKLIFPLQGNSEFNIDLELRGMIDVSKTTASMFGTKLEITMTKAEAGQWLKLDFPRDTPKVEDPPQQPVETPKPDVIQTKTADDGNDSDIDLDDIELVQGAKLMELGELARTCTLLDES